MNGIVIEGNYNNELINILPSFLFRSIFYTELTFCLTCIFKKSKVALIIPILVVLFEKNIGDLLKIMKIDSIFPIKYLQIVNEVTANTAKEIIIAVSYIIVTTIILSILSVIGVKKIKIRN